MIKTNHIQNFKRKALQWASSFDSCCYLDSNGHNDCYGSYELLVAVSSNQTPTSSPNPTEQHNSTPDTFEKLKQQRASTQDWLFGFLGYDLKNEIEQLTSSNADQLQFPEYHFFVPQYLIAIKDGEISVLKGPQHLINSINEIKPNSNNGTSLSVSIKSRFNRNEYISTVNQLKQHIQRGDIYEVSFCQEFYAEKAIINPLDTFVRLNEVSPTPFASFLKIGNKFIMAATPERYLSKKGTRVISQPIKGTAKRGADATEDEYIKQQLRNSSKEQAENVMIVDLVRNDLTKCALPGTVKVDELFGIYSFQQVHQMISTISCTIQPDIDPIDAIKSTFPMGSMTGAPKVRAMQLIEEYEHTKRGVFSGAVGYFDPEGNFDLNVIIRTILYNAEQQYLSFQVGSAITFEATAEMEYDECMLKAKAILEVLN